MGEPSGSLSDEVVRQIQLLIESLEKSTFDYLQVELGDLRITLSKGVPAPAASVLAAPPPAVAAVQTPPAPVTSEPKAPGSSGPAGANQTAPGPVAEPAADGSLTVVAPMLGRFYACPEPGAPPFVSVGAEVGPESTVALIEVMKVFTAIHAGTHGVVTEVCVQNEQYVEYGQILFRIRPGGNAAVGAPRAAKKGARRGSRR